MTLTEAAGTPLFMYASPIAALQPGLSMNLKVPFGFGLRKIGDVYCPLQNEHSDIAPSLPACTWSNSVAGWLSVMFVSPELVQGGEVSAEVAVRCDNHGYVAHSGCGVCGVIAVISRPSDPSAITADR
ncbi:hypothetical protein MSG28_003705 [Choristoneura fumiferana]|uniref:Uncharacterized protein n=1 Tax=Choristoneura fumiferana TaxID=7141 RepID=A0ACC0KFZ4_CHOFU|nr:hypothetical protein MSG28_003705 [Choristoneura fumiferana]